MEDCCTPGCKAMKMIVLGIVLILIRWLTNWDIWIVLGVIAILLGIKVLIWPVCPCHANLKKRK